MLALADVLTRYGAREARFTRAGGSAESAQGPGGSLTTAVNRLGVLALAASLEDGEMLALEDGDVSLELVRRGAVATLRVKWASGPGVRGDARGAPRRARAVPSAAGPRRRDPDGTRRARQRSRSGAPRSDARAPRVRRRRVHEGERRARNHPGNPRRGTSARSRSATPTASAPATSPVRWPAGSAPPTLSPCRARGLLAFFGAGGLPVEAVEAALKKVRTELGDGPRVGFNLLHNPVEPEVEERTVDLYMEHGSTPPRRRSWGSRAPSCGTASTGSSRVRTTGRRPEPGVREDLAGRRRPRCSSVRRRRSSWTAWSPTGS